MTPAKTWMLRIGLLLPVVLVTAAAIPRIVSGLALETAFPVPSYIVKNVVLPRKSYAAAAIVLSHADPRDGETQILRAEAAHSGGAPDSQVIPIVENGLGYNPTSARGWTLLSELLMSSDRQRAGKVLITALEMARCCGTSCRMTGAPFCFVRRGCYGPKPCCMTNFCPWSKLPAALP